MAEKTKKGGGPSGGPGAEGPKQTIPKPSAPPTPVTVAPRAPSAPGGGGRGGGGGGGTPTFANAKPSGRDASTWGEEGPRPNIPTPNIPTPNIPTPNDRGATQGDSGGGAEQGGGGGYDPYAAYQEMLRQQQINNVISVVTALFKQYGLESLTSKIIEYARAGYQGDAIGVMLRDTPEYKARFPAMATLMSKKRAITEAEYIEYERTAAQLEKRYGLPPGLVQGSVTGLLEGEVSASELQDRVVLASDAALQSPQSLRDTFRNYYGIDTGGLAGYFLDPAKATPLLQKQFVASQIGAEAMQQNVGIRVDVAENLQELGVTQDVAREGFANVSRQMAFTGGRGDVVSQEQLIGGNLLQRETDIKEIERAAAARTGRFQTGGTFIQEQGGVSGLKSSAT